MGSSCTKRSVRVHHQDQIIHKDKRDQQHGYDGPALFLNDQKDVNSNEKRICPYSGKGKETPYFNVNKARLVNFETGRTMVDKLFPKVIEPGPCMDKCVGSLVNTPQTKTDGKDRCQEDVIRHAKDFYQQYFSHLNKSDTSEHHSRLNQVLTSIEKTGTYHMTTDELSFGAKTAWRNAPRCIGRIQWTNLKMFDRRDVKTAKEMFEAICHHIEYCTNEGVIRSAITVFPQKKAGKPGFKLWSSQFIRYAGYQQLDGTVIGDPANVEFTEMAQYLGWKGKGGRFDVLPVVLQAAGHPPEWFELPPHLVKEVELVHPKYEWFKDFNLKWYALPAVANMMFDVGGLQFTAAPFSGWYMSSEVGTRNLCDASRYNILPMVAQNMGLDTTTNYSLWKDQALVEVNIAVVHSYQQAGVSMWDHHTASQSFMKHLANEKEARGGCPGDWVWLVPPISGSLCPVFHQELFNYKLFPAFDYQDPSPWVNYFAWNHKAERRFQKISFMGVAQAIKAAISFMNIGISKRLAGTILYATESGTAETFAYELADVFNYIFNVRVCRMDRYKLEDLKDERLLLVVASTFGNGDPPENGEEFSTALESLAKRKSDSNKFTTNNIGPYLAKVRYSVFGLGSSSYPDFCGFAHHIDHLLHSLGGHEICPIGEGDEMAGQREAFYEWIKTTLKNASDAFGVCDNKRLAEATGKLGHVDEHWHPERYRVWPVNDRDLNLCQDLARVHKRPVKQCVLLHKENLHSNNSSRRTILLKLSLGDNYDLQYEPGDHLAVFPSNAPHMVENLLNKIKKQSDPNRRTRLESLKEIYMSSGNRSIWQTERRLPPCSLRTALTHYLDISTPPSQVLLSYLAEHASDKDQQKINELVNDSHAYWHWRSSKYPSLTDVLDEFPSVQIDESMVLVLLPLLKQRFYSISSSLDLHPGQVHLTVGVVNYTTQDGKVHNGVCSTWLDTLKQGDIVPVFIRSAPKFHLPLTPSSPVMMVGPGCGIAPFRSFWQQRQLDKKQRPDKVWGDMTLYFGCRQSGVDQLYKNEIDVAVNSQTLNNVHTAFSREPGQQKVYVQHLLLKNQTDVYKTLTNETSHFYICGDAGMANDVKHTLQSILENSGMSVDDAKSFMLKMKRENRLHEDIFGTAFNKSGTSSQTKEQSEKTPKSRERVENKIANLELY